MTAPAAARAAAAAPLDARAGVRVAVPFLLCTLIWSSTWLVIRSQLGVVPPAWSVTYRFAIAGAAMMLYARWTGARLAFSRREHALAASYGVAQYALNYFAVYLAERTITSGLVAVLFALLILPNALFGWAFLGQRVSRRFVGGSAVALAGIAVLFAHEIDAAGASRAGLVAGIGWALFGTLSASAANVAQASAPARALPVASLVAWGMAWGTVFDAAAAAAIDGAPTLVATPGYWAGLAYLGLVGSALAFTLYFQVVRTIGPARAAYTGVLTPPIAIALSALFEGYRLSPAAAAGGLLGLAGLAVALRARQSASPAR